MLKTSQRANTSTTHLSHPFHQLFLAVPPAHPTHLHSTPKTKKGGHHRYPHLRREDIAFFPVDIERDKGTLCVFGGQFGIARLYPLAGLAPFGGEFDDECGIVLLAGGEDGFPSGESGDVFHGRGGVVFAGGSFGDGTFGGGGAAMVLVFAAAGGRYFSRGGNSCG
jgi:hypothetical protein